MKSYVSGFNNPSSGKFLTRYAKAKQEEKAAAGYNEKEEFKAGYKKGTLRLAVANKFMRLANCGCDRYLEEEKQIVWAKEGDSIVRLDDDLSWVDKFLEEEE